MSEENRRREAALRLFGALSGVDEKYLEDCETDVQKKGNAGGQKDGQLTITFAALTGFMRKHGAAVAAVLCVAVLGVSLAGYPSASRRADDKSLFMPDGAPPQNKVQSMAEAPQDSAVEAVEEYDNAGGEVSEQKPDADAVNNLLQERQPGASGSAGVPAQEAAGKESLIGVPGDDEQSMTLEQVRSLKAVGKYFPASLPDDGEINVLYGRDLTGREKFTMGWNVDAESSAGWFYVIAENLGEQRPEDGCQYTGGIVFPEEDFSKESVEACLTLGWDDTEGLHLPGGTFSVLYAEEENQVLVTFYGTGTVEEVWELMSSVKGQ